MLWGTANASDLIGNLNIFDYTFNGRYIQILKQQMDLSRQYLCPCLFKEDKKETFCSLKVSKPKWPTQAFLCICLFVFALAKLCSTICNNGNLILIRNLSHRTYKMGKSYSLQNFTIHGPLFCNGFVNRWIQSHMIFHMMFLFFRTLAATHKSISPLENSSKKLSSKAARDNWVKFCFVLVYSGGCLMIWWLKKFMYDDTRFRNIE